MRILCFAALVVLLLRLWALAGMLLLGIFLAITLAPIADAIRRRGGPRWLALSVCIALLLGSVGGFLFFVTPLAAAQLGGLIKTLPSIKEHVLARLPASGSMRDLADGLFQSPAFSDPAPLLKRFFDFGALALERTTQFFVVLVITIYLLADGLRVFEWLLAFLPERHRRRALRIAPEIEQVIFAYMGGQLITSLLCAIYTFVILALLHVPNAVLLAIIAGIFDILPIVGFLLSLLPALALAFTVSPSTAWLVAGLYTFYHLLENYLIVPHVYGNRLRLSGLTVLISCLAAGMVAGTVGIVVVLPLVACYPIIERTWLRPVVGVDTVDEHEKIAEGNETTLAGLNSNHSPDGQAVKAPTNNRPVAPPPESLPAREYPTSLAG